ncbi:MAG: WG repeat-containing protein [Crocinitomicaceae bacterium]|nr:WG repeat-containing protein [Crocinitomicaceae bacterium]
MRVIFLIVLITCGITGYAGKLKKGFEALEIYNYFEAKRLFEKSLKKHPVPAAYGLSIIYARNDNPFSNLDSAYSKIKRSFLLYPGLKDSKKEKYDKLGVDSAAIVVQRDIVSELYYRRAVDVNSIYGYQDFIDKHPWSIHLDSAIYKRDQLAFQHAVKSGRSEDFEFFIAAYPDSYFREEAKALMEKALYQEKTFSNSFVDYVNFVKSYPDSPYRDEAENKIYQIATKTGTVEAYRNFIIEFPSNRNVDKAWKYLYNAKLQEEYSSQNIMEFKNEYPEYPFQEELTAEYNVADKVLYPIKSSGSWGFCDKSGRVVIPPIYSSVEWFTEGLAVIRTKDKYGYINKLGKRIVEPQFDDAMPFSEGHALVEQNELWGMIDRNGDFVIPCEYEDLGTLSEGLSYFLEDDLYGYFDSKGIRRLQPQYTEAFDFEEGTAVVSKNDYYGVIDKFGTSLIPFKYEDLFLFRSDKYAALSADYWGVINLKGDTIIPFEYDYIGKPIDNLSIVEMDGEFNYLDTAGNFILPEWVETYSEYRLLARFKKGYAKIQYEDGFNLIDSLGNKLFKKEWDDVGSYSEIIAVKKGDKWGYVNRKGQKVLPFEYTYAQSFKGNAAVVQLSPFYGVIDKQGNYLIDPLQEELRPLNDSIYIAKSLGKYGLITFSGDTLLSYKYTQIEPIDELVVKLEEGGEVFYYNCQNKKFIRRED